ARPFVKGLPFLKSHRVSEGDRAVHLIDQGRIVYSTVEKVGVYVLLGAAVGQVQPTSPKIIADTGRIAVEAADEITLLKGTSLMPITGPKAKLPNSIFPAQSIRMYRTQGTGNKIVFSDKIGVGIRSEFRLGHILLCVIETNKALLAKDQCQ